MSINVYTLEQHNNILPLRISKIKDHTDLEIDLLFYTIFINI